MLLFREFYSSKCVTLIKQGSFSPFLQIHLCRLPPGFLPKFPQLTLSYPTGSRSCRRASTFLRSAFCGSLAGSSYFLPDSFPLARDCGLMDELCFPGETLCPCHILWRLSATVAADKIYINLCLLRKDGFRYASFHRCYSAAHRTSYRRRQLVAGYSVAYVYCGCLAVAIHTRVFRADPFQSGNFVEFHLYLNTR